MSSACVVDALGETAGLGNFKLFSGSGVGIVDELLIHNSVASI